MHPADRLAERIRHCRCPVAVGLDPVYEKLPAALHTDDSKAAHVAAIERFSHGVIDAVANIAACLKVQAACFERYGSAGYAAMERVVGAATSRGMVVILDAKRGDIGISAEHYAVGCRAMNDSHEPSWITINGYLGEDAIRPFIGHDLGAFVLVRTSNPGGDRLQRVVTDSGETVAERMARLVAEIGADSVGACGYSSLGAVVGATRPEEMPGLRQRMPQQVFLLPGLGAQGAEAADVRVCFDSEGLGAVATASRSILYPGTGETADWREPIAAAAEAFAAEVGVLSGWRSTAAAVSRPQ